MILSSPFIHRPVATTLLTIAIALAGAVAYVMLPVAPLPQIDFPTISVGAALPGASPEIMASSVATPLERQFGRIAGVTEMTSASYLGTTSITLQFDLNREIDGAARDVQAAINAARSYLPTNLPSNPVYRKVNPADAPILIVALTSDVYDRGQMYDAASTIMSQRLSQVQGVGQVIVGGSSLPAVRVEINPNQLNSFGLSLQSSREAIYQACLLRFRPILMTTMAALLGALPLALGGGTGSELRRPLGISIAGGLILSQMLTLFTTPVVYLYMDRLSLWWQRIHHRPRMHPAAQHTD